MKNNSDHTMFVESRRSFMKDASKSYEDDDNEDDDEYSKMPHHFSIGMWKPGSSE